MKIAYFDTIAGISGDMTLGACVSAGVSIDDLRSEISKLNLEGVELEAKHIQRNGITAVKIDVVISSSHKHHRSLSDIFKIIESSSLSERVKNDSKKIFNEVAKAESKIHNVSLEKIHFHEVGAFDSIVDIVGAAICFEKLGIERMYSSPIKIGSNGFIHAEHGALPIPTPATAEILRNYPVKLTDIPFELTTPTGAAIIKAMSYGTLETEEFRIDSIGYGAGTKELPQVPNLLRVIIGELIVNYEQDEVVSVETNIDNMNPEVMPYVIEKLLESEALDAYVIPITMKKGRQGSLLTVLVTKPKLDAILRIIFSETTTTGVRIQNIERKKLPRHQEERQTSFGNVKVKVAIYNGTHRIMPEFEECKRLAKARNMPIMQVYKIIEDELSDM